MSDRSRIANRFQIDRKLRCHCGRSDPENVARGAAQNVKRMASNGPSEHDGVPESDQRLSWGWDHRGDTILLHFRIIVLRLSSFALKLFEQHLALEQLRVEIFASSIAIGNAWQNGSEWVFPGGGKHSEPMGFVVRNGIAGFGATSCA